MDKEVIGKRNPTQKNVLAQELIIKLAYSWSNFNL